MTMTTALLFLWYLFSLPTDRLVCTLWVSVPPTDKAMMQACGTSTTLLAPFRLDVVPYGGGDVVCSLPASSLPWVKENCGLNAPLDHYILRIVDPAVTDLLCAVKVNHEGMPTRDEVAAQCPEALAAWDAGRIDARYQTTLTPEPPSAPRCQRPEVTRGAGLYEQPTSAAELWTDDSLTWLAGRLIWWGLVRPECDGLSGLDPVTLAANPCGMASAHPTVTDWQNRYNQDIYSAAITYQVPARLLKRMISVESQWWPWWNGETGAGETGIMQVTENGADVILRYDPNLNPDYLKEDALTQFYTRRLFLDGLTCTWCSLDQMFAHNVTIIPTYARLLAAYRCRAVEINPALSGAEAWRQAVRDYNGSPDYLARVER